MGRKPNNPDAVPRLRQRTMRSGRVFYYYDHGGSPRREEPLGSDYALALKRWAEIEGEQSIPKPEVISLEYVWTRYQESPEFLKDKAPRTQADNRREMAKLLEFFNDPPGPLDAIKPSHVGQYKRWRTKGGTGLVRANRELSLLSVVWNFGREAGYTSMPNPVAGVKRYKETGRKDVYIEDADYARVMEHASPWLRDAMELAYLTGQRPADVLKISEHDVRDGMIHVQQGKTKVKVRIEVIGGLPELLARIRERKRGHKVFSTRLVVNRYGRAVGVHAVSVWWKDACMAAGVYGVHFRDLRAKAATDTEEGADLRTAQRQLGHTRITTTEGYVRNRKGAKVAPTGGIAVQVENCGADGVKPEKKNP